MGLGLCTTAQNSRKSTRRGSHGLFRERPHPIPGSRGLRLPATPNFGPSHHATPNFGPSHHATTPRRNSAPKIRRPCTKATAQKIHNGKSATPPHRKSTTENPNTENPQRKILTQKIRQARESNTPPDAPAATTAPSSHGASRHALPTTLHAAPAPAAAVALGDSAPRRQSRRNDVQRNSAPRRQNSHRTDSRFFGLNNRDLGIH